MQELKATWKSWKVCWSFQVRIGRRAIRQLQRRRCACPAVFSRPASLQPHNYVIGQRPLVKRADRKGELQWYLRRDIQYNLGS